MAALRRARRRRTLAIGPRRARDRITRLLLATSCAVLVVTMVLALSWALGEATGLPHPTLAWMAATHGLGNALGFALCSVLAWRRLHDRTGHEIGTITKEGPREPLTHPGEGRTA
ncbi:MULTISPECIES: YndJ family transporter [unclassified Streptomyces]|uniref:YndJ family transporter n=1 Tax=unclassified Streptomyces TaxID=2593676 RepID=UPI0036ECBA54